MTRRTQVSMMAATAAGDTISTGIKRIFLFERSMVAARDTVPTATTFQRSLGAETLRGADSLVEYAPVDHGSWIRGTQQITL